MLTLKFVRGGFLSPKQARKLILLIAISFVFNFILFSTPVLAEEAVEQERILALRSGEVLAATEVGDNNLIAESEVLNRLPENLNRHSRKVAEVTVTAYNSEAGQCDNSPCITANGFNVCEHKVEDTVALNFLPFGTNIKIPELFGDRIFTVRDRMNSRYSDRVDVWMVNKIDALKFGKKVVEIEVLE